MASSRSEHVDVNPGQADTNVIMFLFMMGTPWVPTFRGGKVESQDIHFQEWVWPQQAILDMQPLKETQKVSMLISNLEGEAKREVLVLNLEERRTVQQVIVALEQVYGDCVPLAAVRSQFFSCKQRPQETVREYALSLQEFKNRLQRRGD